MEKISVIVPIYNVFNYLDKCIESIVHQTYPELEIILVNDGSPDLSDEICRKWEKIDNRILYIKQENQGVSVARNNGLMKSSGNYILFVDGDDYLEESMIEKMYSFLCESKVELVVSGYHLESAKTYRPIQYFNHTALILVENNKKEIYEKVIKDLGVPWGKLYSRKFLIEHNILFKVGLKRMQDTIFNLDVFRQIRQFAYLDEPLYHYRIFQESACNKYSPHFDQIAKEMLAYFKQFLIQNDLWNEFQYLYYSKMLILVIETIKLKYIPDECSLSFFEKRKAIIHEISNFELNFSFVAVKFLDMRNRLGFYFLRNKLYCLFYIIYKINYRIKKKKSFK